MKELNPIGGGGTHRWCPPLDPPMSAVYLSFINIRQLPHAQTQNPDPDPTTQITKTDQIFLHIY